MWSMIVQRSLFQPNVYPKKFCTPLHAGGVRGGLPPPRGDPGGGGGRSPLAGGFGGDRFPGGGLRGSAPEAKNKCKIAL